MKKLLTIILMLLLVLSLGLLSACGKDDPADQPQEPADQTEQPADTQEPEPEQSSGLILDQDVSGLESQQDEALVGDWFISNTELYGRETDGYTRLSFSQDGDYEQYVLSDGKETTVSGTWTVATGQLIMIANDRNVAYDYEVTPEALTLISGDSSMAFTHTQPE